MNRPAGTSSVTSELMPTQRHESARRRGCPRIWIPPAAPIMYQGDAAVPLPTSLLLYGKGHRDVTRIQTLAAVTSQARFQSWRRTFSADEEMPQRTRSEATFKVDGLSPTRRPRTRGHSSRTQTSMDPTAATQARIPEQTTAREGDPYDCEADSGFEGSLGCDPRMFLDSDEGLAQSQPWFLRIRRDLRGRRSLKQGMDRGGSAEDGRGAAS